MLRAVRILFDIIFYIYERFEGRRESNKKNEKGHNYETTHGCSL